MKILYEMTYSTRGQSGIPRDTNTLAQILLNSEGVDPDFIFNPRSYTRRKNPKISGLQWSSNELGDTLRKDPGRSAIPPIFVTFLILLQSLSFRRIVAKIKLDSMQKANVFNFLHLNTSPKKLTDSNVFLLSISYIARFTRPSFLKPFRVRTEGYPLFIQQQVDPIQVDKKTTHIVRLHDFLPISQPQYFDQNAVRVFSKSLRIMLSGRQKVWVMDSVITAEEFKNYFGVQLDVRVIPCVVEVSRSHEVESSKKKNQVCMVNTIEPRKRVGLAIAGFREAKDTGKIPEDWKLFIVGNEGWQEKTLASNLRKQIFGNDIIFREGIPDFELNKIYSESKIVLSTSAAEGFGLPPLEGMAYGCLPVVSDIPQHRETVQDLGLYFEGDLPQKVAEKLGEAHTILAENGKDLANKMIKHVQTNYSQDVIGKRWLDLLMDVQK